MISRFFIDRPIFASVLSIVITLAGAIALFAMPIALYPPISPPVVQVDCRFPGASAQVVAESVATPIEEQVNGVEDMMYMSSQCTNDGSYNLTVTFKHGVDLNVAQVLVQNRVSLAIPRLPDVLKQTGVTTRKKSPDILMAIAISSPDASRTQLYLSNYALMHIKDELARVPGVSDVNMMGQRDYSMRIWVDPEQLAARSMTASDVVAALRSQNMQVATGQIGQPPVAAGQRTQLTLSTMGRLIEVEQFENVIVRATPEGRVVRIKDVARVELGSKNEDVSGRVNGNPTVSLAVFQLPDANALDVADVVKAKIAELAADFPPGVGYEIRYDTTPFIRESIEEVFKTLREAIVLVAIVVLLFLQSWRSSIIPLIAVPVAIVGTFAVLIAMGFTLNNLTLFGLVLAIGIVVDDAIVVVEAVEHHIERGLKPRAATIKAMEEVSGPVIAIGLVLSAVFVPCAFISGIVGQFFRQFALTIATSTLISTFNSLTLSPALAAMLLRPKGHGGNEALPRQAYALLGGWLGWKYLTPLFAPRLVHQDTAAAWAVVLLAIAAGLTVGWLVSKILNRLFGGFFGLFNWGFRRGTGAYTRVVGWMLRVSFIVLLGYGGLLYLTYWGLSHTPSGFIPSQDMGYLLVNVQLPDSAASERSAAVMNRLEKIAHEVPGVKHTQSTSGMSLLLSANGSNFGSMFVILDEFSKRRAPNLSSDAIAKQLRERYENDVPEAIMTVLGPPPVRGVGRAGGFKLMVEDRGDLGSRTLQGQTENLVDQAKNVKVEAKADSPWDALKTLLGSSKVPQKEGVQKEGAQKPAFVGLTSVFRANVPQLYAEVNRKECMAKEVQLQDLFDTLRIYLGSLYVNDFNRFGRTWQVIVQADAKFRNTIDDAKRLKVRNAKGTMVPVAALADIREDTGPLVLTRYNMYPAAPVNGSSAPGVSSGTGIELMERLAKAELLPSMATEWTELAYLEIQAGNTAMIVFGFAVVMVFLVLAAQYESWSLPLAVILVVPMCLLGSIIGVRYSGSDINIFTQIGFVVLVGLASKNAILIVEFSKSLREQGETPREATLQACRLRLRPIVMTSLAFILGVVPLITSHGAGAEMRRILGTTVFSGMIGVTFFGIFLTPVFFYVIDRLSESRLLHLKWIERVSDALLGLLSLRFLRKLGRRTRPLAITAPSSNGHGTNGHVPLSLKPDLKEPATIAPTPTNGAGLHTEQALVESKGGNSSTHPQTVTPTNGMAPHVHETPPTSNG
ncbi:efflux RND transporter permease subunit [Singulisphaera acidiphila]|uniref:Cation/multidrug efflux pump n=1 Tax=Singulisphaera acidiphila (strain ATCC BAA-1392 / DSM 18658 / VKM B-2454 / MOB10) TaxID=886293 RepID=L0DMQ8_SINAD|nr:efflux RND transporter permease subunit [Singulisphaera acidiphila]AGA30128.1 cation/multidrug efflux pump [Singulisphaera acidiphila DSM 18658]